MAIINVPNDQPTIQLAVNAASRGDVIMVENDTYNEEVSIDSAVPDNRNHIRIIANGKNVVLDGTGLTNPIAFDIANDTIGVEIKGFKIQNYDVGIRLISNANRIICNKIINVDVGIMLDDNARRNLIWKNTVKDAITYGISIEGPAPPNLNSFNNRLIENVVHRNNTGVYLDNSDRTVILGNKIFDNTVGIEITSTSSECVLLNNEIKDNDGDGLRLFSDRCIVSRNEIKRNGGNGIDTASTSFDNIIQENIIEKNTENGIVIENGATTNTIIRNCINFNGEDGINIEGNDNNIVQNKVCSNTVLDIDDNDMDNDFFDNECKNSNTSGVCTSFNCNPCICEFDFYCDQICGPSPVCKLPQIRITNKVMTAVVVDKGCMLTLKCGKIFDRSLPPRLNDEMPPVKLASVNVDTRSLCNPCVKIEYSSIINAIALNGATGNTITLEFRLTKECKNREKETLREWEYIQSGLGKSQNAFTVTFCECLGCFDIDCCTYTIELIQVAP